MVQILVIDDDDVIRASLCEMLRLSGFEVRTAENGHVGMNLFAQAPADLVITDIVMPEKEGLETIVELRRLCPKVKIIAISGGLTGPAKGYLAAARGLGADRVLSKPFTLQDLLKLMKELLGQKVEEGSMKKIVGSDQSVDHCGSRLPACG
ncbi:MAG: response regulator [Thermoanaerobaculales bacterium]|nr:response regulator [Thermoanaerobaculales bacterium]